VPKETHESCSNSHEFGGAAFLIEIFRAEADFIKMWL
jgi:hypothetical protein